MGRSCEEPPGIGAGEMLSKESSQFIVAPLAKGVIEIALAGIDDDGLDAVFPCTGREFRGRHPAGLIGVTDDVEPAQGWRQGEGCEVVCGEGCGHGKFGQDLPEREHRLDAFADSQHVLMPAEAHSLTEQVAHGPPRCGKRCLAPA